MDITGKYLSKKEQGIAELRCLTLLDRAAADRIMQNTIPSRNIVHALERIIAESLIQDHQFFTYMTQYLLGCSMSSAMMCIGNGSSIFQALDVARQNDIIDDQTHTIAINAYCFLAEPREVLRGVHERRTEIDNFEALAGYFESHGLANANIAGILLGTA